MATIGEDFSCLLFEVLFHHHLCDFQSIACLVILGPLLTILGESVGYLCSVAEIDGFELDSEDFKKPDQVGFRVSTIQI